ncbi:MAG: hypothetical protein AAGA53_09520 [Pseudomonadota bacterium]
MALHKIILAFLLLLATLQTLAAENLTLTNRWYVSLRTVDRPSFERLLTNDAQIELKQLGVIQDKTEFIESLDNWDDVAADLLISNTIVSSSQTRIVLDVCYQFPSDSFTNRETFFFKAGRIERQVQERLREEC